MGIRGIKNLAGSERIDVTFTKGDREVTIHAAKDLEDAKQHFQWTYGYWPDNEHVRKIETYEV